MPDESLVAVVKAKAFRDRVPERFGAAVKVVIVESKPAESDDANNQAAATWFFSWMRRASFPRSSWLRDSGRMGTKILSGELGGDVGTMLEG